MAIYCTYVVLEQTPRLLLADGGFGRFALTCVQGIWPRGGFENPARKAFLVPFYFVLFFPVVV